MRFIIACMVIVGLCLFAMPLIPVFNGVQKEREAILANAATGINLDVPPPVLDSAAPEMDVALDADAAALAGIEPAAGDVMDANEFVTPGAFVGGFTNEAPAALADEPAPIPSEME